MGLVPCEGNGMACRTPLVSDSGLVHLAPLLFLMPTSFAPLPVLLPFIWCTSGLSSSLS